MEKQITEQAIMKALDWSYDKAISGIPSIFFVSSEELADNYLSKDGDIHKQVNSLIKWQIAKAGTSGFLTGLGGIAAMPISIPANLTSVLCIQIRMIAAIAHMGGYDLKSDQVKTLIYTCLAGNTAKDVLKDLGIVFGIKITTSTIKRISGKTITAINQKVGFRFLTKFGEKGVVNLGKTVPVIGGVIGGTVDSLATKVMGNLAKDTFIGN